MRKRAVCMALEHRGEYPSLWATIESIAPKIGCVPQTLNDWVCQHEVDKGVRDGVNSDERARIKDLEREVKELRKANEIFKLASVFCPGGAGPPAEVLGSFVDQHHDTHGVEPFCNVPQIAQTPWVSDFTDVSTWQGWRYVAFVIDALERALLDRHPERSEALIHHSDRGSQYVSILYIERLAEACIEPSVGSRGDSYDNALAETINGLYKAELIHRRAPWKTKQELELVTLKWVAWFNHHPLLSSIGYIPPAEAEVNDYRQLAGKTETEVST